ncbi:MAG: hypothetical protein ACO3ZD_12635 [Cyanobium sp.]
MSLVEVVSASVILMLGCSSAAQLMSRGGQSSVELKQWGVLQAQLDTLMVASEGKARQLASTQVPATDCQVAAALLEPELQALPAALAPGAQVSLSFSSAGAGLMHVRWEVPWQNTTLKRERLLSASALGLCQEGGYAP